MCKVIVIKIVFKQLLFLIEYICETNRNIYSIFFIWGLRIMLQDQLVLSIFLLFVALLVISNHVVWKF